MPIFGQKVTDGGATALENQRQANITSGQGQINAQFAGFDPKFYDNYQKTVLGAETPQLMDQYQNTNKNLTYALARGGNLQGSVAQQEHESLDKQLGANEAQLAGQAANSTNALKASVQNQKAALTGQLVEGGTPSSVAASAAADAAGFQAPAVTKPLGDLFADWSQQYLNQQNAAAYGAQTRATNPLSMALNAAYGQ